jgi:hypothetical protein
MDFLSREGSPISAELWSKIDEQVISMAKKVLVGRRFLHIYGPLGAGVQSINIDDSTQLAENEGDIVQIKGRKFEQIPLLNQDFSLLWRDLELSEKTGIPIDLSSALQASAEISKKEDELIFNGNKELGYEGLLTAKGITKLELSNWEEGENPVKDITAGIDAVSEATPMITYNYTGEIMDLNSLILGNIPGAIGESYKILIILAAIYLIYTKTASLEIMLGCLIGFFTVGTFLYYIYDGINPIYGMMMGGFLFGTVFMATDPISAAKTKKGKWIFGIIIGVVTVLIRSLSLFNGGMMFAILMGNTFAPIIDHFIKEAEKRKKSKAVAA